MARRGTSGVGAGDPTGDTRLRFQVLGPVRAWRIEPSGERELELGPAKQRAVLGVLALNTGSVVSRETIMDFLWSDDPPPSAVNAVQTYVKRLRGVLEPERQRRAASRVLPAVRGGYLLAADPESVDLYRFRALAADGRHAAERGDVERASRLRERGIALADTPVADLGPMLRMNPRVTALEQELLGAALEYIDGEFAAGRGGKVLPLIERLAGENPLHEPLQARLMLAYLAAGRQADALAVHERVRVRLRDDLGVDPGRELRQAHETVLHATEAGPSGGAGRHGLAYDLVGRDGELRRLAGLVQSRRMVTLTGPGGTGKTALAGALAELAADRYADGTVTVELGRLPVEPDGGDRRGGHVADAVSGALGLPRHRSGSATTGIAAALQGKRMLIVLDNAEHVVHDCGVLVDHLNRSCPSTTLLVTSRRPLGLAAETVWEVAPLAVPDADGDDAGVAAYASVQLMLRRAAGSCPDLDLSGQLPLVARLCRRLDGLPLAIELAAARLRSMSLSDLDHWLTRQPAVLSRTGTVGLPHQQTIDTTFEWSRRLLSPWQRLLLGRLSVLSGPFELDTVERVCGFAPLSASEIAPLLGDLVNSSLVQPVRGEQYRYRMLTSIREFARARARPEDLRATRGRHLAWCHSLMRATEAADSADRPARIEEVRRQRDDVFAALAWSLGPTAAADGRELGVQLLAAGRAVWDAEQRSLETVRYWTQRALDGAQSLPRPTQAVLLHWAGRLAWLTGRPTQARSLLTRAADDYDMTDSDERRRRVDVLTGLSAVSGRLADEDAVRRARELVATAREVGDPELLARTLANAADQIGTWGHLDEIKRIMAEARSISAGDRRLLLSCDYREVALSVRDHRPADAVAASERALAGAADLPSSAAIDVLVYRAWAHVLAGEFDRARASLSRARDLLHRSGRTVSAAHHTLAAAMTEYRAGAPESARAPLRSCLHACLSTYDLMTGMSAVALAGLLAGGTGGARLLGLARYCRSVTGAPAWPFDPAEVEVPADGPYRVELAEGLDEQASQVIVHAVETAIATPVLAEAST